MPVLQQAISEQLGIGDAHEHTVSLRERIRISKPNLFYLKQYRGNAL